MRTLRQLAVWSLAGWCAVSSWSCSSNGEVEDEDSEEAGAPAAGAADSAQLKQDLALAQKKLGRAKLDQSQQEIDAAAAVQKATEELGAAKRALQHFDEFDRPRKLAEAALSLQNAQDNLVEQEEEMQQLELMYSQDELGDKTKEIVLARGKRRLDTVRQRLEIARRVTADLENFQLVEERQKLALTVTEKEQALKRATFEQESGRADKQIAVEEQQSAVKKAEQELQKASTKAGG